MVLISVVGLGNMNNSHAIYDFVQQGTAKGIIDICIDLKDCDGMDSTFMGTLLLMHEEAYQRKGKLFMINLSDYNKMKLEELGLAEFLDIDVDQDLPDVEFEELPIDDVGQDRMKLILRAHEELVAKNEQNREKFESFINSLRSSFKSSSKEA